MDDRLVNHLEETGAYVKILREVHSQKDHKEILAKVVDIVFTAEVEVFDAEMTEYLNRENK